MSKNKRYLTIYKFYAKFIATVLFIEHFNLKNQMKNPLFFLLSSIMMVACSKSSMLCEEVGPNSKQVINSSFVISIEEQNSICDSFAVMLSNQESLAKVIENATTHSNYIDIVFDPYLCDSENQYNDIVDGFSAFDREYQQGFSEMVTKICERNYLRLHAYVPNGAKTICQYNEGDTIYVINALYNKALKEKANGIYKVEHVIVDGKFVALDLFCDEDFANNHLTFVLSFRDYIENWEHFALGNQSISDLLIRNFVRFEGSGYCTSEEVYKSFMDSEMGLRIVWEIVYGKKVGECDDRYNRFCKLKIHKKATDLLMYEFESDPYHTTWIPYDVSGTQCIKIIDNPLRIDLTGYYFPIEETKISVEDIQIVIPEQICKYNKEKDAIFFEAWQL